MLVSWKLKYYVEVFVIFQKISWHGDLLNDVSPCYILGKSDKQAGQHFKVASRRKIQQHFLTRIKLKVIGLCKMSSNVIWDPNSWAKVCCGWVVVVVVVVVVVGVYPILLIGFGRLSVSPQNHELCRKFSFSQEIIRNLRYCVHWIPVRRQVCTYVIIFLISNNYFCFVFHDKVRLLILGKFLLTNERTEFQKIDRIRNAY